jgi:GTP-binding protein
MLVDETRVFVASGKGGDGSASFRREKYRPLGGPDGGDGGRGGSVVFVADDSVTSLSWLKDHPHQRAKLGTMGGRNNRTGAEAEDLVVPVPPGTLIRDESGTLLADLACPGDRSVVAKGGRGGRGNTALINAQRRAPSFAELGEPGEERWLNLELTLIADVAVIGLPNAGKSTLVGAVSGAHPKIGAYPFTTLEPTLGIVEHRDARFSICDIPGLVEGAHLGKGLGLKFLRHGRRSAMFIQMVDATSDADPVADYETVRHELASYDPELGDRPTVVALNKVDLCSPEDVEERLRRLREAGIMALAISAAAPTGLSELLDEVADCLAAERGRSQAAQGFQLYSRPPDSITVFREGEGWRVESRVVRRWVAMTDLSNAEAVSYLQMRLERHGVEEKLRKAGAKPGDDVIIGGKVFSWWPRGTAAGLEEFQDAAQQATDGRRRRGR